MENTGGPAEISAGPPVFGGYVTVTSSMGANEIGLPDRHATSGATLTEERSTFSRTPPPARIDCPERSVTPESTVTAVWVLSDHLVPGGHTTVTSVSGGTIRRQHPSASRRKVPATIAEKDEWDSGLVTVSPSTDTMA